MATYIINADATRYSGTGTSNFSVQGYSSTWSTARTGSTKAVASSLRTGVYLDSTTYYALQAFLTFNTSVLEGDLGSVTLHLVKWVTGGSQTIQIRKHPYGATLEATDFVSGASLSGLPLAGSFVSPNATGTTSGQVAPQIAVSTITKGGETQFVLHGDKQIPTTTPSTYASNNEQYYYPGTSSGPRLTIKTAFPSTLLGVQTGAVQLSDGSTVYLETDGATSTLLKKVNTAGVVTTLENMSSGWGVTIRSTQQMGLTCDADDNIIVAYFDGQSSTFSDVCIRAFDSDGTYIYGRTTGSTSGMPGAIDIVFCDAGSGQAGRGRLLLVYTDQDGTYQYQLLDVDRLINGGALTASGASPDWLVASSTYTNTIGTGLSLATDVFGGTTVGVAAFSQSGTTKRIRKSIVRLGSTVTTMRTDIDTNWDPDLTSVRMLRVVGMGDNGFGLLYGDGWINYENLAFNTAIYSTSESDYFDAVWDGRDLWVYYWDGETRSELRRRRVLPRTWLVSGGHSIVDGRLQVSLVNYNYTYGYTFIDNVQGIDLIVGIDDQATSSSGSTYGGKYFEVGAKSQTETSRRFFMYVDSSNLQMVADGGTTAIPYDHVAHRWWRITEDAGTFRYWTSPDRVTWTERASLTHGATDLKKWSFGVGAEAFDDTTTGNVYLDPVEVDGVTLVWSDQAGFDSPETVATFTDGGTGTDIRAVNDLRVWRDAEIHLNRTLAGGTLQFVRQPMVPALPFEAFVLPPEANTLTSEQLQALIHAPNLSVDFGAMLMAPNLAYIEDISDDLIDGSISRNIFDTIHGTCRLRLTRPLRWGIDLVRPYMVLSDGVVTARWDVGVYALTTPDRVLGEDPETYEVAGYDRLMFLNRHVGADYSVAAGTTYRAAILKAFADAGLSGVNIEGSAADNVLPATKTWPLVPKDESNPDQTDTPVTWLRVINDLLRQINFRAVYADQSGMFRCESYIDPATRASKWVFDVDDIHTIVGDGGVLSEDVWATPNRWVFRATNFGTGVEGNGVYTYDLPSSDPMSADNRGLVWAEVIDYEAASQAKLVELGNRRVAEDRRHTSTLDVTTGPFPGAGHGDIYEYRDIVIGNSKVQAVSWSFDISGSDVQWEWEKVIT